MTNNHPEPIDNNDVVPNRGQLQITTTLTKDGGTLDLTGRTVTCTIRRELKPNDVVDSLLEDHVVVITTPASGLTTLTLEDATLQTIAVPEEQTRSWSYLFAYKVVEDPFFVQTLRIFFHGVLN